MATVAKKCDVCGEEYQGHHNSKRCPQCKAVADGKVGTVAIENSAEGIGSDIVVEGGLTSDHATPQEKFEAMVDADYRHKPFWREYGMCEDGYEVFPGWVWSQKKLVCVSGDAPKEVLEMLQDAFQRRVVNRRPTLGDSDYGVVR